MNRVVARPNDMAPRRAYAKWLRAQGDLRGECIELMLQKKLDKKREARLNEIFEQASSAIEADIVAHGGIAFIERGLVEDIAVDLPTLVKHGDAWFARHPIRIVRLAIHTRSVAKLRDLAACKFLSRIEKLELDISEHDFSALWESRNLTALERLELSAIGVAPSAKGLANLAKLRTPKLRSIRLFCIEGYERALRALAAAKQLSALRTVEISGGEDETTITAGALRKGFGEPKKVRAQ